MLIKEIKQMQLSRVFTNKHVLFLEATIDVQLRSWDKLRHIYNSVTAARGFKSGQEVTDLKNKLKTEFTASTSGMLKGLIRSFKKHLKKNGHVDSKGNLTVSLPLLKTYITEGAGKSMFDIGHVSFAGGTYSSGYEVGPYKEKPASFNDMVVSFKDILGELRKNEGQSHPVHHINLKEWHIYMGWVPPAYYKEASIKSVVLSNDKLKKHSPASIKETLITSFIKLYKQKYDKLSDNGKISWYAVYYPEIHDAAQVYLKLQKLPTSIEEQTKLILDAVKVVNNTRGFSATAARGAKALVNPAYRKKSDFVSLRDLYDKMNKKSKTKQAPVSTTKTAADTSRVQSSPAKPPAPNVKSLDKTSVDELVELIYSARLAHNPQHTLNLVQALYNKIKYGDERFKRARLEVVISKIEIVYSRHDKRDVLIRRWSAMVKRVLKTPVKREVVKHHALWHDGANYAADMIFLYKNTETGLTSVLLIQRKDGSWAMPGGFEDKNRPGKTAAQSTAIRELKEETGVDIDKLKVGKQPLKIKFYTKVLGKKRDPRNDDERWVVSHVFSTRYSGDVFPQNITAKKDPDGGAKTVKFWPVPKISSLPFFADHKKVLQGFFKQKRIKK